MTPQEKFIAVLSSGPILAPDALVVLCGEDALPRVDYAMGKVQEFAFWAMQKKVEDYAPPVVLTGGIHTPPAKWGAEELAPKLMAQGLSHDRIMVDARAMNTREQAVNTIALVTEHGWRRLMLVVSPYHSFRAFLTFLQAAKDAGIDRAMEINVTPASHVPWWKPPEGCEVTRLELLDQEMEKVGEYGDHVASWTDGLEYLEYWEGREEAR